MAKQGCGQCRFRAKYDNNPDSLFGRIWKWHTTWCPGWKRYMKSLSHEERTRLARKYELKKFL